MKIPKLNKWQIIEVEWIDSCHVFGWSKDSDYVFSDDDLVHNTIGYLLKETNYSIAMVQSRISKPSKTARNSVDALMEIPKCAIRKLRQLK